MTKEPFKNELLSFFRKTNIKVKSIGRSIILVETGVLKQHLITVDRSRVSVSNSLFGKSSVKISLDFPVNYSIETFLYKLFRYNFIDITQYLKMSDQWRKIN